MTPRFHRLLKQHIAKDRLSLHTRTTISTQSYDPSSETWTISTDPPIPNLPAFDYIYFATGVQSDFNSLPCLQTLATRYPVQSFEGLPALNEDLMWKDEVPLFVTGRMAALRLGPGAGNLEVCKKKMPMPSSHGITVDTQRDRAHV